jgi:FkbM family methyltransferase
MHRAHVLWRYARGQPHEPDFRAFALFAERKGLFLDIGANRGQSALSFRLFHSAPILSIEANPLLEVDLRWIRRLLRGFDYRICAAAPENGTIDLHVPMYRDLPLVGEASVDAGAARHGHWLRQQHVGDAAESIRLRAVTVAAVRLDDLELAPAFVKIDVEGGEAGVVAGLTRTLHSHRPVVLVERSAAIEQLSTLMEDAVYRPCVYEPDRHRLVPYTGQEVQNIFYLPRPDARARMGSPATSHE